MGEVFHLGLSCSTTTIRYHKNYFVLHNQNGPNNKLTITMISLN